MSEEWSGHVNRRDKHSTWHQAESQSEYKAPKALLAVSVALVVVVDEGPIFIYNKHTGGCALSRPRRKKVIHCRPTGSHQLIEVETLQPVPEPHDSQVMEVATRSFHKI